MRKENKKVKMVLLKEKLNELKAIVGQCIELIDSEDHEEPVPINKKAIQNTKIDFSIPIRPFMKRYSSKMSGPKKFVLFVAHFTKGELDKTIELELIQKEWGKMISLLGFDFHPSYPSRAKDEDWVESKKQGSYNLRPSWIEVME